MKNYPYNNFLVLRFSSEMKGQNFIYIKVPPSYVPTKFYYSHSSMFTKQIKYSRALDMRRIFYLLPNKIFDLIKHFTDKMKLRESNSNKFSILLICLFLSKFCTFSSKSYIVQSVGRFHSLSLDFYSTTCHYVYQHLNDTFPMKSFTKAPCILGRRRKKILVQCT